MQNVLTQMNVQIANVISDLSGWTGQAIIRAILDGERHPAHLAALADPRVRATHEAIAQSLQGTWRPDLLFLLKQHVDLYDMYQRQIRECDQELERHLKTFAEKVRSDDSPTSTPAPNGATRPFTKRRTKAHPHFNLGAELHRISGVDLTRIDGIDVGVAHTVISEVGLDMSRWKTAGHFASWLGLCPNNKTSGDKGLGRATRPVANRATTALRIAATSLLQSRSYPGA